MNYAKMLQQHIDSGADVTVGTIQIPTKEASRQFGVIEVDKDWRIQGFDEKPAHPKESPHNPGLCNASMGIYIFNTQLLIPILLADSEDPKSHHDFGKDILPRIITKHRVFAYNFVDENSKTSNYWRDVGTVDAYYEANLDLVGVSPVFNLYDDAWPLRTWQHQYPPAKFVFGDPDRLGVAVDSIVGGGSIYPAVQNLLLACRAFGLGATLTTLLCMEEPKVRTLLAIPDDWVTAAYLPLGYPEGRGFGSLSRKPVEAVTFLDRWDRPLF